MSEQLTNTRRKRPAVLRLKLICRVMACAAWTSPYCATAGIPEPDVTFYGTVSSTAASAPYAPGAVAWTISGNTEKLTSSATTMVVVNDQAFYLTRIPFETRALANNTSLEATPNTLALTATSTTYTRTATVDGRTATLTSGTASFSYGAATQGLIERIDLSVGGESFAAWSQRFFGSLVSLTTDADGDGLSNYDEYLAGTDPKNPQSGLFVKNFLPTTAGGFTFSWDSLTNKVYSVERSTDLRTWNTVLLNKPGTGALMTYTDAQAAPHMFYRVRAIDP